MTTPVRATLITGVVALVLIASGLIYFFTTDRARSAADAESPPPSAVGADSIVLDDGGPDAVTVVEFLDFECEACGAFYPYVEQLRERYAGDITYVVRYFPLPGHVNAVDAALAAEAAGRQGRFEDMYHRLFQSQADWGEATDSRAAVFRDFAADLGLDLDEYDATVADPATLARVQSDVDEGRRLGVRSTPTFFVDGRPVEVRGPDDLPDAIDEAVAR
jgi:protein-disulfide isomerase